MQLELFEYYWRYDFYNYWDELQPEKIINMENEL